MFVLQAEEEAGIVGEILQSEPLTGSQATKEVSSSLQMIQLSQSQSLFQNWSLTIKMKHP